ncbi:MAG: D-2-hydroxyacid dehydrogenase [Clostridiales bacterium]|nr:D-2-hydroxyacid dehydrogenase [Clostridiales bacterium]
MKIVILDGYTENPGDLSWDFLQEVGDTEIYDRTPKDKIVERAKDAEILITNKTPITREIIDKLSKLKFVALLSTGYNIADYEHLREKHIPVSNIPSYSTEAVAQHVMAFILEMTNEVGLHSCSVKSGDWCKSDDFCYWKTPLTELNGKTLGIFGFGRIGKAVAQRANAFGMRIISYTPRLHDGNPDYVKFVTKENMIKNSDFITLHCPLTPETEGCVNREFIHDMKDGAYLINTSRGTVVDEQALADALNSGKLSGAGLDVLSTEPPKKDNPLLTAKNCFITPHIAWAAFETRERLMDIFKGNIDAFLAGKPRNVVNPW